MSDVVVVGAGPVGMLTAALLADRGIDVEVIEQRETPSAHSRAIGIHPPAIEALSRAGVAVEAIERGVRIERGEVRCDGHLLGSLSFASTNGRYPFVLSLPQRQTEELLRARLVELGVPVRQGRVSSASVDRGGVRLCIDGTELTARLVVGADGTRSAVRSAAGIDWRGGGRTVDYVMADYPDETGFGSTAVLFFERGGVVESFPLPGSRRRWVAMTDRDWSSASRDELAELIADRTGYRPRGGNDGGGSSVGGGSGVDGVNGFRVRQHLADRMVSGPVVLAGDSAHEISPIGGQGMNLGWLDALALAPAIEAELRYADAAALLSYAVARRRSAVIASRQAAFNMGMGLPASGARLAGRNAAVRMLAIPPAKAVVARAFTMRWL